MLEQLAVTIVAGVQCMTCILLNATNASGMMLKLQLAAAIHAEGTMLEQRRDFGTDAGVTRPKQQLELMHHMLDVHWSTCS